MSQSNYLKSELYNLIKTDESIFDFIQESSLDGLWYWDMVNMEEEWMNPKFWTTLGYDPQKMPHKAEAWKDIIHKDDLKLAIENLHKHLKDPKHPYDQVVRYEHKEGHTVWIRCRGLAIRDKNGTPIRLLGAHTDITLEKQQSELLDLTSKVANIGGWEADLRTKKITWTDVTRKIHEVEKDYIPDWDSAISFYKEGEHRDRILRIIQNVTTTGEEWDEDFMIITAKGNERWVRGHGKVELINGKAIRLYGTFQNINKEKLNELQLAHSEELFRKIFDNAAIGMATVNLDGRWEKVNKSLCDILGYEEKELLEKTFQELTFPEDLDRDLVLQQELKDRIRESYQIEKRYVKKNGSVVWVVIAVTLFKNEKGRPVHFISQMTDITNEKLGQQKILENKWELESILNATETVSIIGTDLNGVITTFNKGAENLLGYRAEEVLQQHTPILFHDSSEIKMRGKALLPNINDYSSTLDVLMQTVKTGKMGHMEWTYLGKDGGTFPVQLMVTPRKSIYGEVNGFLGVAIDISSLKQAEDSLKSLNLSIENKNELLLQKNEELQHFSFMAAHDLQEPLRMITGFLSLLEKRYNDILDDKGKEYIHYAVDGSKRMQVLIQDILKYSQSGEGEDVDLDLNIIVEDIVDQFKNESKYAQAKINNHHLPRVYADSTAMTQLFTNIIGNGLKYQPEENIPEIHIMAENLPDYFLFEIRDNGIGIEPKYYDQVFLLFNRLHTKEEYSGTGIGMATCRKIVERYNGKIWIEPNEPQGTKVCFTLKKGIGKI